MSESAKLKTNDILVIRRCLSVVCYTCMLAADAYIAYTIYRSYSGGITYYLGQLIFVPVFIFSYWMSTFYAQLSGGREGGKRIFPKWLNFLLNGLSTLLSVVFLAFWGYIYYNQLMYTPANEQAVIQAAEIFTGL